MGYLVVRYSRKQDKKHRPLKSLKKCNLLSSTDTILHLAWSTLPAIAQNKKTIAHKKDLKFLKELLRNIKKKFIKEKPHFIFFSSGGAVYGNALKRPSKEFDKCRPVGTYGKGKLAAENIIKNLDTLQKPFCTILRISNIFGQNLDFRRKQGLIARAIYCALQNKKLIIWGNGEAKKDYLYFDDLTKCLQEIIKNKPFGTFNLCYGKSFSINQILRQIEKYTNKQIVCEHHQKKQWDVINSRLNGLLLRRKLKWKPKCSLEQGIKQAVIDIKTKLQTKNRI